MERMERDKVAEELFMLLSPEEQERIISSLKCLVSAQSQDSAEQE